MAKGVWLSQCIAVQAMHKLAPNLKGRFNFCGSVIPVNTRKKYCKDNLFLQVQLLLFTGENIFHSCNGDFDGNKHICQDSSRRLYALLDKSIEK